SLLQRRPEAVDDLHRLGATIHAVLHFHHSHLDGIGIGRSRFLVSLPDPAVGLESETKADCRAFARHRFQIGPLLPADRLLPRWARVIQVAPLRWTVVRSALA